MINALIAPCRFMIRSAVDYFPIRVVFDDKKSIDVTKPHCKEPSLLPVLLGVCCMCTAVIPSANSILSQLLLMSTLPYCFSAWRVLGVQCLQRSRILLRHSASWDFLTALTSRVESSASPVLLLRSRLFVTCGRGWASCQHPRSIS